MKTFLIVLCLLVAGCNETGITVGMPRMGAAPATLERPVNLPISIRQPNWLGSQRQGSCVWATCINLLRWQGQPAAAERLKKYGNGEYAERFEERLANEGIRLVQITNGDMAFIDAACRSRRGCGAVVMGGKHMIAVVDASETQIGILDSNDISQITYVSRDEFETEFKNSGGWAFAVIYAPSPPMPPPFRNHP